MRPSKIPLPKFSRGCIEILRRFHRDRSAMGGVEFAILLPIMIMTYIGVVEVADGFTVKRKINVATSALGDLVTRGTTISTSEMNNILDATEAVVAPFDASNLRSKVTCVTIDKDEVATVVWSAARHDTADSEDDTKTVPDGVSLANSKLVIAEVHYQYTPAIGYVLTGPIDIEGVVYTKPRESNRVCYDGKCC